MTDQVGDVLIVFTRFPVAGKTKTRLIPTLGETGAAELQRQMTEKTLCYARQAGVPIEVWYTGGTEKQMSDWLGNDLHYVEQNEGKSGERMELAFQSAFGRGNQRVVLIASDCPSNRTENIQSAFKALRKSDVVLGPSIDGGYYLLGLRSYVLQLIMFEDIDWGSASVLKQTLSSAAGVRLAHLPLLHNVDTPADIPPKISVVIPTLNEAEHIGPVLSRVLDSFSVEVIVVDGGSEDDSVVYTAAYADAIGAKVIETSPGRAHQMNAGAGAATGEILLFLYADTLLPKNWDMTLREALSDGVALGAFRFRIDEELPGSRWIMWGVNLRSHAFALPYGSQGLFMKQETFKKVGGFPDQPILEDYKLVRRMRKMGRIITLEDSVIVSARHWKKHGVFKTVCRNQFILFAYRCHIPVKWIQKLRQQAR